MQLTTFRKQKLSSRSGGAPEEKEAGASFLAIFGFSVIGLLAAVILTEAPMQGDFVSTKLLLVLLAAPVAALLGFTFGSSD